MSPAALFIFLCFQGLRGAPLPPPGSQPGMAAVPSLAAAETDPRVAAYQQSLFVKSYNRLLETLGDFAVRYNRDHAIDVKKLRALKKAWRDLEKSEAWLRPEKGER
jgi:hypothetical protein